jgi:hypothetical protein
VVVTTVRTLEALLDPEVTIRADPLVLGRRDEPTVAGDKNPGTGVDAVAGWLSWSEPEGELASAALPALAASCASGAARAGDL